MAQKKPKSASVIPDSKTPRSSQSPLDSTPRWSFSLVDTDGPFCWKPMGILGLAEILSKLKNLETMTWNEIEKAGSHNVAASEIDGAAYARLREIGQEDVDEIFSMRMSSKERIWGLRVGNVCKIMWWDPEHRVFPSNKKHT